MDRPIINIRKCLQLIYSPTNDEDIENILPVFRTLRSSSEDRETGQALL